MFEFIASGLLRPHPTVTGLFSTSSLSAAVLLGLSGCGAPPAVSVPAPAASAISPERLSTQAVSGAVASGTYRNMFREANPQLTEQNVTDKLDAAWNRYFSSPNTRTQLYYPVKSSNDKPMAQIRNVAPGSDNQDVRSEGMSYGMMLAVQLDHQAEFNALWNFAYTKMRHTSGERAGYFRWRVKFDGSDPTPGTVNSLNPAPDGEECLAMALFFASGRWGNGAGIYNYRTQADNILNVMLHKEDMNGGIKASVTNMFLYNNAFHSGQDYNQVVFVPYGDSATFTDPSYHLPAFYELWSRWAAGYQGQTKADRQRWGKIRDASRGYLFGRAVKANGLNPDYSNFDGSASADPMHGNYEYDAWRVGMNWGVDQHWFAPTGSADYGTWADALQGFMENKGIGTFSNTYALNGKALDSSHEVGHLGMVAAAGLAATDTARAKRFTNALWNVGQDALPADDYRYYSGLLYMFGLLNESGRYRVYAPR